MGAITDQSLGTNRYRAELSSADPDIWEAWEASLIANGVPVPLRHRTPWLREVGGGDHRFLRVVDEHDGSVVLASPVSVIDVRSLPGHSSLRVARFGYRSPPDAMAAALATLREAVEEEPDTLGARVESFVPDPHDRERMEGLATEMGFRAPSASRSYRLTPRLDLDADEADLMAGFTGSCRRFIRNPEKKGYAVRLVQDEGWVDRMGELWTETFERTGARPPARDWRRHLVFAARHPDLYRIVGVFAPGEERPDALCAFAGAMNNGDHAVYSDGASTRDVESGVALTYAPMWDLIRWAKRQGLEWFDMGGTTTDEDDPRAGISDFKRRFTDTVVEVGGEWEYRSQSLRGKVFDLVKAARSALGG